MLVIGHRGARGLAPENTLESLRVGCEAGVDMLEFDIHVTKDGVPVVIHDATTYRTHGERIVIAKVSFAELRERTKTQPIPSLEEVLDEFFGVVLLNIEVKSRGSGKAAATLLERKYIKSQKDWDNALFSSFKAAELAGVRRISKKANLALLHHINPFGFIAYQKQLQLTAVGFHRLYINALTIEIAKRAGLFTYAYTVNRPETALTLVQRGIDGIVTDRPDIILKKIKKHSR